MPDYASMIQADPEFIRRLAPLLEQRQNAIVGFGDATGIPGVDANVAGLAAGNQYSTLAQLQHLLRQNQQGIQNNSNSQGLLFSGAHAQQQQNEAYAGQGREQDARSQLLSLLNQSKQDEASAYGDVYQRLLNAPPGIGDPAPAAAPAAPPVAPGAAPVTPLGTGSTAGADVIKPLHPYLTPAPVTPRRPAPPRYGVWSGRGL